VRKTSARVRSQRQLPRCCIAAWFERTASQQTWEGENEDV